MIIDSNTCLYGVFGNPVHHSKGPLIHNACFKHYKHNAVYLAFEVDDINGAVRAVKSMKMKGVSVTIPYKSDVMNFMDKIDPDAQKIGAVNTIVNQNGHLTGYNTDCQAAVLPLMHLGIQNKHVCIIGAGGAAQAVAHGIKKQRGKVLIVNRSHDAGAALADNVGAKFISLADEKQLGRQKIDILINTTPVGMFPKVDAMPIPLSCLHPEMVVMDIVYNPLKTRLLQEAEKMGCEIVDGLSMFLYQAAAQFELWTGINPDLNIMRHAVMSGDK